MGTEYDYFRHPDPEHRRWGEKYPRFPGVAECFRLLHRRNVHGAWVDIIEYELTAHAGDCLQELIDVYRSEENDWYRRFALWAITNAPLAQAIPFLAEVARDRNPEFAAIALQGLAEIDTKEARTILWKLNNPSQHRPRPE